MKTTNKTVAGVLSQDGRAEIERSQMNESEKSEKLADPTKGKTPVAAEPPKKQLIRVEITLVGTYKPIGKKRTPNSEASRGAPGTGDVAPNRAIFLS